MAYANYYNFTGRTTRREYWFFILFFYVVAFALWMTSAVFEDAPISVTADKLLCAFGLFSAIPAFTAAIRRVRDAGKRWWCCLIPLYSLILFCSKSDDKQSGKQAKGASAFGVILALATVGFITYSVFKSDTFDTSLSSTIGELKELSAGNGKETSDVPQESEDDGVALCEAGLKYYNGDGVEKASKRLGQAALKRPRGLKAIWAVY